MEEVKWGGLPLSLVRIILGFLDGFVGYYELAGVNKYYRDLINNGECQQMLQDELRERLEYTLCDEFGLGHRAETCASANAKGALLFT
jgi:hypothetical protein